LAFSTPRDTGRIPEKVSEITGSLTPTDGTDIVLSSTSSAVVWRPRLDPKSGGEWADRIAGVADSARAVTLPRRDPPYFTSMPKHWCSPTAARTCPFVADDACPVRPYADRSARSGEAERPSPPRSSDGLSEDWPTGARRRNRAASRSQTAEPIASRPQIKPRP